MPTTESYLDEDHDFEQLRQLVADGKLSPSSLVTADQLRIQPGQTITDKAKELGVSKEALHRWTMEWRGSGYHEDYVIRRPGHRNWYKNKWTEKDWTALVRTEIAKGRARHVGDVVLAVGLTATNVQVWSMRHTEFGDTLWQSGVPKPKYHFREFISWIRHPTIERYRQLTAEKIASGMGEIEAMHRAGDEAVNELKHKTRQRRRVERDQLIGVTMHEEMLRRWQQPKQLWSAHSKRIGRKLLKVTRYAAMELGLREAGFSEPDVKRMIGELMDAYSVSDETGQAKWKKLRDRILRKKSHREAQTIAEHAEAKAIQQLPSVRASKFMKKQISKAKR